MQTDDPNLLADLDLSQYDDSERQTIAQNIYARLEDRVGEKTAAMVPDDKFEEFELLVDQASDERLDEWLDTNIPDYDNLVSTELDNLKNEFKANPGAFLGTTTTE